MESTQVVDKYFVFVMDDRYFSVFKIIISLLLTNSL